ILGRIARACDFTLQKVLDMKLDRKQGRLIDKGATETPRELREAADAMLGVVKRLQSEGYSGESFWTLSLPVIARAADVYRMASEAGQADSAEAHALHA